MNETLQRRIAEALTDGRLLPSRGEIEAKYPGRHLPDGAQVTRFCPSPTGFVHIGTIFTAQISQFLAHQTRGVYILRIEDTDKKREVEGATELIAKQLDAFGLQADEGLQADGNELGGYGPYIQSRRRDIYLAYALELLKAGRAYPCFATADELAEAVRDQQAKKLRPGYYGQWALWRDRSEDDVTAALEADQPFVLRFRSQGDNSKRIEFDDILKGIVSMPENDLDVPLIKSDESHLPTYHLAHVVDDYLMGATVILRGEEWLPSTPLHIELAKTLGIPPFRYAHLPVISIIDPNSGGKRKLSKRKDPEADVAYWHKAAYPLKSVKAYLLGLANSNFDDWYREHPGAELSEFSFSLERLKTSRSPLLDMKKVEDYARDEIARMPQERFNEEVLAWSKLHDSKLYEAMTQDPHYTKRVLSIERAGDKPRKDLSKWSDAPALFSYFYDDLFAEITKEEIDGLTDEERKTASRTFLKAYDPSADKDSWFENMKQAAVDAGYAISRKDFIDLPGQFKGGISEFAQIIRLTLTGRTRTPDLWTIMQVMGEDRVRNRLSS